MPRSRPPCPLDPTGAEFRALLDTTADYLVSALDRLPDAPASDTGGVAELLADETVRRPPPARGRPLSELLDVVDRAAAKGINIPSPGALAFVPGGGLVSAAVADLVADVLNRFTGQAMPAPGLVAMETDLLCWLGDLFGLPAGAAGVLTTGGSLATLSAMITARHARLGQDFQSGAVYVTGQTHHSAAKAVRLAGLPETAVRVVPVDSHLRMDVTALRAMVTRDRAAQLRPFCVVATAGTTNTGTVDPLPAIAAAAADEGLWLHVDAAYGGFFQLTERGRDRMRGIDRADSLVVDAHKGLFLPFGTGCLLVRDGELLRRAHCGPDVDYLQDLAGGGLPDFADYGPELTREFRGLRLWLPLHLHGVDAFRRALDDRLDLARHAYQELAVDPHLAVPVPPDLSTVAFHVQGDDPAGARTAEVLRRVNAERRVVLSSTRIGGRYVGRICILNHRTDRDRVDVAVGSVRRHARALVHGDARAA